MDLRTFFEDEGVDLFAEVSIESLPDADRVSVLQFFPAARSMIVFGNEVPAAVYLMPARDQTREMLRIAETLDGAAIRLAGLLNAGHVPSRPVPLYLPVRVADGRVQGVVRLKHIAAAGGLGQIGKNTVLITPRFGPRLLLSGVATARPVPESGPGREAREGDARLCTECGQCIKGCPEYAIGPDGVDAFRCRTVRAWVPPLLVPAALWMLRRQLLLRCIAPLAPWIAKTATIRCSLCVTGCPKFPGDAGEAVPRVDHSG